MLGISALDLARIQFAFTVSFHIIFPAITIGLASYLAVLEGLWLWTKSRVYRDLYHFWVKIFAVTFAMGVVSGLVMAYQFGTNWSYFSYVGGGITGPMLAYEVLTAFFLEAGFLGVALFGWNKVGPALHFFATLMVALGTLVSATWILASNSWMQTPAGFTIEGGRVIPVDWLAVIFNPSFPYRLAHMTIAAYLATALFVGASGAWHLLRGNNTARVRAMLSMAMWMTVIVAPIQIEAGDQHGLNTLQYQPEKIAAIEGHWRNKPGEAVPLILFGWPDMATETTKYAVEIPHLGSVILTHTWDGQFRGLADFPANDRPNSTVVFWTFRIMVGLAFLMLALGLWSLWLRLRGDLYRFAPVPAFRPAYGPFRHPRHPRWMVYDGDRPPALGRLWRHAHQRRRLQPFGAGAHNLARCFRRNVFHRLRHRRFLHSKTRRRRAAGSRAGTTAPRDRPQRRRAAQRAPLASAFGRA